MVVKEVVKFLTITDRHNGSSIWQKVNSVTQRCNLWKFANVLVCQPPWIWRCTKCYKNLSNTEKKQLDDTITL